MVVALIVVGIIWFDDWSSSGKMDIYIRRHSNPDYTPRLLLVLGKAYAMAQQPQTATRYFLWLLEDFPDSSHVPSARFHLAQCYEDMGERPKAMQQYILLKDSYPDTSYGRTAQRRWEYSRY